MTCPKCEHSRTKRFGTFGKARIQRYRCRDCGATFTEPRQKPLGRHYTDVDTATRIVELLMEGMSIRAVSRLTGTHKNTILRLLLTVGEKCRRLFDARVRNMRPRFVQADELWTFVGKKQRQVKWDDSPVLGDTYLWVALDSDTKAVLAYHLGKRDQGSAVEFMADLSTRLAGRCQLTTDGLNWYLDAVEIAFGADLDFAQLVKMYTRPSVGGPDWFRPGKVIAVRRLPVTGDPNPDRISTSHVERFNLTVRMHLRRFTRLTNAFSKSVDHLRAAIGLFIAWYNFCKVHQSVRVTPAMEAGLTDHVWSIQELLMA